MRPCRTLEKMERNIIKVLLLLCAFNAPQAPSPHQGRLHGGVLWVVLEFGIVKSESFSEFYELALMVNNFVSFLF